MADYPDAARRYRAAAEWPNGVRRDRDRGGDRAGLGPRVQATLAHLGDAPAELATVEAVAQLFRETAELTEGPYRPRFTLPK